MGTFSRIYIKEPNLRKVKDLINQFYKIEGEEILDVEQDWRYWENGHDTIILSNNYNELWTEVQLNYFSSVYQHDELLRQMSRIFENEILLAYYQSTCGDGRFARFHNGKLETSIVQKVIELSGEQQMRLIDNWGISNELRSLFKIPKLKERFFEIDIDSSYKFFKHYSLEWDGKERDDQKFVHLEINYE